MLRFASLAFLLLLVVVDHNIWSDPSSIVPVVSSYVVVTQPVTSAVHRKRDGHSSHAGTIYPLGNENTPILFRHSLQLLLSSQNDGSNDETAADDMTTTTTATRDDDISNKDIYQNGVAKFLSNFMSSQPNDNNNSMSSDKEFLVFMQRRNQILNDILPLQLTDDYWNQPKIPKLPMEVLAQALDYELYQKEWFVTGHVNPIYFSSTNFTFQDPDVTLNQIRSYATGVQQIFDYRNTARAEIISTVVNYSHDKNTITCTWRLSGKVNIGPGLVIKPYIVYTDFTVCPDTGLIIHQRDRFDIPSWDILISALFPFLIGTLTSPPAPKPKPRTPVMPNLSKYL